VTQSEYLLAESERWERRALLSDLAHKGQCGLHDGPQPVLSRISPASSRFKGNTLAIATFVSFGSEAMILPSLVRDIWLPLRRMTRIVG
jgi:hypothetical protein